MPFGKSSPPICIYICEMTCKTTSVSIHLPLRCIKKEENTSQQALIVY